MLKLIAYTGLRHFNRNLTGNLINLLSLTIGFTIAVIVFTFISYQLTFDTFHEQSEKIYRISQIDNTVDGQVFKSRTPFPLHKALGSSPHIDEVSHTFGPWSQNLYLEEEKFQQEGVLYVDPAFGTMFSIEWVSGSPDLLEDPNAIILTESTAAKLFRDQDPLGQVIDIERKAQAVVRGIVKDSPYNSSLSYHAIASKRLLEKVQPFVLQDSWVSYSPGQTWVLLGNKENKGALESQLEQLISTHLGNDNALQTDYELTELINLHLDARFGGNPKSISKTTLYSVLFMGVFVLFTSVLNFINLHTSQTMRRLGEVGIKKILGSNKTLILVQFLVEALVLALVAGLLAIVLATNLFGQVNNSLSIISINLSLGAPALQFLIAIILLVTALSLIYPLRVTSAMDAAQLLRNHKARATKSKNFFRGILLMIQFTFAQVLIAIVLVFFSQFSYMQSIDPGFETQGIFMFQNFMPGYIQPPARIQGVKDRLLQHPQISAVSFGTGGPNANNPWSTQIDDPQSGQKLQVDYKHVDVGYKALFGLKVAEGRWFNPSDYQSPSQEVVVSMNLVERLGVTDASSFIGRNLTVGQVPTVVVGILEDFHSASLHSEIRPVLFEADFEGYGQGFFQYAPGSYQEVARYFEKVSNELNGNYIPQYSSFDDELASEYEVEQVMFRFIFITTALAILVCTLGLYSLVSYTIQQRTKEIGIRKAIGAGENALLLSISRRYIILIVLSTIIAAPLSFMLGNSWLQDFAYHKSFQFQFLLYATLALAAISFLSIFRKSLQAIKASPVKALKYE